MAGHICEFAPHPRLQFAACKCGAVKNAKTGNVLKPRPDSDGYHIIGGGQMGTYKVHRLVLACFAGESELEVDHRDRVRSNNALSNLRYLSVPQNRRNVGVSSRSQSGIRNVRFREDKGKWQAYCRRDGKFRSLGHFITAEEAEAVAREHYHA